MPNGGTYLQIMSAKDLYIQNITAAKHDGHSDSFQVKFPNIFKYYLLGAVRVVDQRFKDWDHYKFRKFINGNTTEFHSLLCQFCLQCICGASQR